MTQLTDARLANRHDRKLQAPAVVAIREAYVTGDISVRALSELHGVSESTVSKIISGQAHRDAGGLILPKERLAELAAKHLADGRRQAIGKHKGACPGCGEPGHHITRCPDPRPRGR